MFFLKATLLPQRKERNLKICYNGRKEKYRVKEKESLDITSKLRIPGGLKVTKSGVGYYGITRSNGSEFDGGE